MVNIKQRIKYSLVLQMTFCSVKICIAFLFLVILCQPILCAKTVSSLSFTDDEIRTKETAFGNLVADAVRDSAKADGAIIPASAFKKAMLDSNEISAEELAAALAFPDDTIFVLELTGEQIKSALEHSVSIYPKKNLAFLQISGIAFVFDSAQKEGSRVIASTIDGKPISESKKYRIATTSSLANGALGYWRIWQKENIVEKTKTTLLQALQNFLSKKTVLDYSNLNRIKVRG